MMLKVDGVMSKADSLMLGLDTLAGGKDGGELFQTVKSIRELAEDFDKRSGALMADGRRTLADISRAVNNLDRNPTRLIFGPASSAAAPPPAPAAAAVERAAAVTRLGIDGFILRDASLRDAPLDEVWSLDEVLDPHGEEPRLARRLEPRGH